MKIDKLNDMKLGWFVGNFEPSLYKTENVEVAVKHYKNGDYEKSHSHKIATEITVIAKGKVKMNDTEYCEGDIITIPPNEFTDFLALDDNTMTIVVKIPGAKNDKYMR